MVATLKRLSTHYIETEDRIRFAGEIEQVEPVIFWMTQRVAARLVAALVKLLEKQAATADSLPEGGRELLQSFAQEAAIAELKPQTPVAPGAAGSGWLTRSVDVTPTRSGVILTFRGDDGQSAILVMDLTQLRQWLAIVHALWSRADWPLAVWPSWMGDEAPPAQPSVRH